MRRRDCARNLDTPNVCETPADYNEVLILECRTSLKRAAGTRLGIARVLRVG